MAGKWPCENDCEQDASTIFTAHLAKLALTVCRGSPYSCDSLRANSCIIRAVALFNRGYLVGYITSKPPGIQSDAAVFQSLTPTAIAFPALNAFHANDQSTRP